jgi:thiol-disulfide isomerase/thioredoxin
MQQVILREFTSEIPLAREREVGTAEYLGLLDVAGTECDVVRVTFGGTGQAIQWAFAARDRLPRQVERTFRTPRGTTTLRTTITQLEALPRFESDVFELAQPEGFSRPQPRRAPSGLLEIGSDAPDFALPDPEGNLISLKDLRGKIVALDFWATWCGPCRMAMPGVQRLHEKFKDEPVKVFGVNCHERSKQVKPAEFVRKQGYTYPLLLEGDKVALQYKARGIPTFYLIGPDGKILHAYRGLNREAEIETEELIQETLEKMGHAREATTQPVGDGGPEAARGE